MRSIITFMITLSSLITTAQTINPNENITFTTSWKKTKVTSLENGDLQVNISRRDFRKFKKTKVVQYNDFGAVGDGKADDMDAITATHAFANQHGFTVKANDGATYYIGGKDRIAVCTPLNSSTPIA